MAAGIKETGEMKRIKKYPISIPKYDRDLLFMLAVARNREYDDLASEVEHIRREMIGSSKDGLVGFISGKTYERTKELATMARSYRNAIAREGA